MKTEDAAPRIKPVLSIFGEPGGTEHCCRCGSHQQTFDLIQHTPLCERIRAEQEWTDCVFCAKATPPVAEIADRKTETWSEFVEGVKEGIADSEAGRTSPLTETAVPEGARLKDAEVESSNLTREWYGGSWLDMVGGARKIADAATEKGYRKGYEDGINAANEAVLATVAKVRAELEG